jgi:steroid delta-isomerase-like uncharacterized protein
MSTESNKAAVRRFHEAFKAGELDDADEIFAPNAVIHMAGSPEPIGMDEFKQVGEVFLNAFPDGVPTIEDMIVEGNTVVSRLSFRGTHTGDLMGIPPTGKSVLLSTVTIDQFADGKIVESWRLFDQMTMMQQLGVIPAPE